MNAKWPLLASLLVCHALAGCGIPLQEEPEEFAMSPVSAPPPNSSSGASTATVYLVDELRLIPVDRGTSETSLPAVLSLLVTGPTKAEAEEGLRSALTLGSLDPVTLERGPRVRNQIIEVGATKSFVRTTGEDQLLATAQIVWTATEDSSVRLVRVVVGGDPIELPTDTGLTPDPVSRADYRTVQPRAND